MTCGQIYSKAGLLAFSATTFDLTIDKENIRKCTARLSAEQKTAIDRVSVRGHDRNFGIFNALQAASISPSHYKMLAFSHVDKGMVIGMFTSADADNLGWAGSLLKSHELRICRFAYGQFLDNPRLKLLELACLCWSGWTLTVKLSREGGEEIPSSVHAVNVSTTTNDGSNLNFLTTCRQVYHEATHLAFGVTNFGVNVNLGNTA
jgi:hypothetical protein